MLIELIARLPKPQLNRFVFPSSSGIAISNDFDVDFVGMIVVRFHDSIRVEGVYKPTEIGTLTANFEACLHICVLIEHLRVNSGCWATFRHVKIQISSIQDGHSTRTSHGIKVLEIQGIEVFLHTVSSRLTQGWTLRLR